MRRENQVITSHLCVQPRFPSPRGRAGAGRCWPTAVDRQPVRCPRGAGEAAPAVPSGRARWQGQGSGCINGTFNPVWGSGRHLERSYLSGSGREPVVREEVRRTRRRPEGGRRERACGQGAGRIYKTPSRPRLEAVHRDGRPDALIHRPSGSAAVNGDGLEKDSGARL